MEKVFHVDILTPYGKYLSTDATFLSVKTGMGVIGILPNHAPLITTLEISKLVIKNNNDNLVYAISGGILSIKKGTQVTLLVSSIESRDEIDVDRALKAKQRAEERLASDEEIDVTRAKVALARALNRISVHDDL